MKKISGGMSCKRRGFHCQTHLKNTWIPAAKQLERRQQQQQLQGGDERHEEYDHHNSSPTGLGEVNFAAVVSLPAEFKCYRISIVDDNSEGKEYEYAYSTEINIGGHVFKGILYDYGPDPDNVSNNSSTTVEGGFNLISPTPSSPTTSSLGGN